MTKDKALKLALEALNTTESDCGGRAWEREQEAITAIKEALAQPEPEYLAFMDTPQRTWVWLTDKEIDELWMSHHDDFGNSLSATGYERAIEAALKAKNT